MSKKHKGLGKVLLGTGIGVGLGMLLTKRTGKENREILKNKIDELTSKLKNIDSEEIKNNIQNKVDDIMATLSDLDKEKALSIAKEKSKELKEKSEDLVQYVIEKGTPVLEKTASTIKEKVILVTKDVLRRLEQEEK